jgi:hypothetical protein
MGGEWLTPRPGRFTPGKETRYPLYRRLGGSQSRYGRVGKISPTPGMDPTAQLVSSRCADYAYRLLKAMYSHKILVVNAEENTSHVRLRLRWKDNIRSDVRQTGCKYADRIPMDQDKDRPL